MRVMEADIDWQMVWQIEDGNKWGEWIVEQPNLFQLTKFCVGYHPNKSTQMETDTESLVKISNTKNNVQAQLKAGRGCVPTSLYHHYNNIYFPVLTPVVTLCILISSCSSSCLQSGGGRECGCGEEHSAGGFDPRWAGQWQRLCSAETLQTQTWNGERQDQQCGQWYPGFWPGGTGELLVMLRINMASAKWGKCQRLSQVFQFILKTSEQHL